MSSCRYRGIEIASEHVEMARNLAIVDELIDELRELQSTWNNLALLGELANVGAEITGTRQDFHSLATDLTNFLVEQASRQAIEGLATRAQNSIDILVRNLYERTADIGFLATDPVLVDFCHSARTGQLPESDRHAMKMRLLQYVEKYSVYRNVLVLDDRGDLLTDLKDELPAGESLAWVQQAVQQAVVKGKHYTELFRVLDTENGQTELIYAWQINKDSGTAGYVALVFNLEEEGKALFSRVLGVADQPGMLEWKVCGVLREDGEIILSSNPHYLGPGQQVRLSGDRSWGIVQSGPVACLACIRPTRGYQGYQGPGWKGFCLVPLGQAFASMGPTEADRLPALDLENSLVDPRISGIQLRAAEIQGQLNRSIWNGNLSQRHGGAPLGHTFSKTLLREISRAGERTRNLFTESLQNMVQGEIQAFQLEQQARAMLAIDLMDRNLYERANDCRWWAVNPLLRQALSEPGNRQIHTDAVKCLKHINSLYTVYNNILLLDCKGKVVADSAGLVQPGILIEESWVSSALRLKRPGEYCVSPFAPTPLYQGRPTYIYAAAVFENPDRPGNVLGVLAVVFDSEPQFEAILNESMGESIHKAFAFILDEKNAVIASTTNLYCEGGRLSLPLKPCSNFRKQQADRGYFVHQGHLIAYGLCNSGSYREYKSSSDPYQNNLTCLFGLDLGPVLLPEQQKINSISFAEFRQAEQRDAVMDLASFRAGDHWYGIDSEDALEAFVCKQLVSMPNSPHWVVGSTIYRKEAVTVIDLARLLNSGFSDRKKSIHHSQMILLKNREPGPRIALMVDELGEIPGLPMSAIDEADHLDNQGGAIQGLVKTRDNLLIVLNVEQLLVQLETGMKKPPAFTGGPSSIRLALN